LATGGDYWEVNSIQLSQTIGEWWWHLAGINAEFVIIN
jgi:hypothetical protein